jgi:hypothetical protein
MFKGRERLASRGSCARQSVLQLGPQQTKAIDPTWQHVQEVQPSTDSVVRGVAALATRCDQPPWGGLTGRSIPYGHDAAAWEREVVLHGWTYTPGR